MDEIDLPQAAPLPAPCPVADTMRRVQAELRAGSPPSFEALLAFGAPGSH